MKVPAKYKDEKAASLLSKFAAEYFLTESNQESLITITKAEILDRGKRATVFFTALPQEKEPAALEFAKRHRSDFRQYVTAKKSFGFTPKIDFAIDLGEHNRQKIDALLIENETKNC